MDNNNNNKNEYETQANFGQEILPLNICCSRQNYWALITSRGELTPQNCHQEISTLNRSSSADKKIKYMLCLLLG